MYTSEFKFFAALILILLPLCVAFLSEAETSASPVTVSAAKIVVSTASALENAVDNAVAGDTIEVVDGVYNTNGSMTIRNSGTALEPIVIRAQNIGGAELTGETYFNPRQVAHIVIEGFVFTGTDITAIKLEACNNIRITRNTFRLQETSSLKWIIIQGIWNDPDALSHHNRIDHNLFEDKHMPGNFITVDGTPDPTYLSSQYDLIDHNHFRNIGPRVQNEMEAVRVGWSELSMSSGYTTVEYNLFEECDGDPEIISVKTSDDTVRYNTFRKCQGSLVLRHGNRSIVNGNFFLGEQKAGSGGVRIYGDDHQIYNNYFEGLTGQNWDAAITLTNGDYDSGSNLSRHFRINRALIANNTLVDNLHNIEIGFTNNGNYSKPPRDMILQNNLVWGSENELVHVFTAALNTTWQQNLMFPQGNATLGITATPQQIRVTDPMLVLIDSLYRLDANSPAIDSAAQVSWLIDDIDGQARGNFADIGADEFSNAPIVRFPLKADDVGPFVDDPMTAIATDGLQPGTANKFVLKGNYPNPFNPTTTIEFELPAASLVTLEIYDIIGRQVAGAYRDTHLRAGAHKFIWDATDANGNPVASGLYFYRLQAGDAAETGKMMLIR